MKRRQQMLDNIDAPSLTEQLVTTAERHVADIRVVLRQAEQPAA